MNTIKVFLGTSGAVESMDKDFNLFQYQFQNKLLNVYVPTAIMSPQIIQWENGEPVGTYTDGTAIMSYSKYITTQGKTYQSQPYYLRYVKTLYVNNVEYALFERLLPKEFTQFAGSGNTAPKMVFQVLSVNTTESPAILHTITSSQEIAIDVLPSFEGDIDYAESPSDSAEIHAELDEIKETLEDKQDKHDETLQTTAKYVANAINEVDGKTAQNAQNIVILGGQVAQNTQDIQNLIGATIMGVTQIGTLTTIGAVATTQELDDFVQSVVSRPPRVNDIVINIVTMVSDTDTIYLCIYGASGWTINQVQLLESASNVAKGIVGGNYDVSLDVNTMVVDQLYVDIQNGYINNIYCCIEYATNQKAIMDLKTDFAFMLKILNGQQAVSKAIGDENGLNIATNYATKDFAKNYTREYATPRILYEYKYLDFAIGTLKNANVGDMSYSSALNASGSQTFVNTLATDVMLGNQNGSTFSFFLVPKVIGDFTITINAYYSHEGQSVLMGSKQKAIPTAGMIVDQPIEVDLKIVFDQISTPITLEIGDTISYVVTYTLSASAQFELWSNTTYPSMAYLDKIGYSRYILAGTPVDISFGDNASISIQSNTIAVITGDGTITFQDGTTQNITNKIQIPVWTDSSSPIYNLGKLVTADAIHNYCDLYYAKSVIPTPMSVTIVQLTPQYSIRLRSAVNALTLNMISLASIELDYESELIFETGASWTGLTDNTGANYTGDDCSGGAFIPQASSKYNVIYYNDSATSTPSIQAIVSKR